MTRAHFKFLAKQQLGGKVGTLFLASLLSLAVQFAGLVLMGVAVGVLAATMGESGIIIGIAIAVLLYFAQMIIVIPALNLGRVMMIQRIAANPCEPIKASYIFKGFKHFWGAFKVQFFSGLFTWLWSLLFIIPAYIKVFSYSQAMYVYAENPDMGALECITRSKMMMRGRKFDYFSLIFISFCPWTMLAPFTLFILYVWLLPYMELTSVNFYNHAKRVPGSPIYGFPTYGEIIPAQAFMPNPMKDSYQEDLTSTEAPVEETPEAPVEEAPVEEAPVEEAPVEEAPVEEVIAEETVEETVIDEIVINEDIIAETEAVIEETVIDETVIESPVEETDKE